MTQLLAYLLDRYNQIVEFFSTLYGVVRDWALNGKSWVTSRISSAWNSLTNLAAEIVQRAQAWFRQAMDYADQLFGDIWHDLTSWAAGQINNLRGWVSSQLAALLASAAALTTGLRADVSGWMAALKTMVTSWLDSHRALVDTLLSPFIVMRAGLQTILAWLTADKKTRLDMLSSTLFNTLSVFVAQPLRFISNLLIDILSDMVCNALAYALGTVSATLPPKWNYDEGSSSGDYIPGEPPPPGASGLVAPLDPLYISGYTYDSGHHGVDYGCTAGQAVFACHTGSVLAAGWSSVGYGNYIDLQGEGWWSRYAHLASIQVTVGQTIKQGSVLGGGDSTGNSTGNHLHLELKYNGVYVDPITVL